MNYYNNLNNLINEIERNLTNDIDYKKLARIIGTSSYTLQRIFAFLTGITLTEYIRKRRLSKAAEELLSSDIKIIDLSLKYQYDSPVSFSNSFKKMHGISPNNVRKKHTKIKTYPKIEFKPIIETLEELEYRIMKVKKHKLYGITTGIIDRDEYKEILKLYDKSRKEKILDFIIENSDGKELYYGVSEDIYHGEIYKEKKYYILGKKQRHDFVSIEIPNATYACFKLKNKEQKDIIKLYNTIFTKWLPTSEYKEILDYPELEIYYEDDCEICIPVK